MILGQINQLTTTEYHPETEISDELKKAIRKLIKSREKELKELAKFD